MAETLAVGEATRAHRSVDSLHAMVYFAPEAEEELTRVGLRPGRMCYFASRSAAMGPVSTAVTVATFYNFNPALVARSIPRAWGLASVEDILAARYRAVDRSLRRLLGADVAQRADVAELAGLTRAATEGLRAHGRPLYAAHADLPWPDEAHLALWHAITLLREYRGDGHIAALLGAELSGLEALVTHTATGSGFTVAAAKATRGWSDEEWDAAIAGLRDRELLDADGLTDAGVRLRDSVEVATDRLGAAPWLTLGVDRLTRLVQIGRALTTEIAGAGAFPDGVFATRR